MVVRTQIKYLFLLTCSNLKRNTYAVKESFQFLFKVKLMDASNNWEIEIMPERCSFVMLNTPIIVSLNMALLEYDA